MFNNYTHTHSTIKEFPRESFSAHPSNYVSSPVEPQLDRSPKISNVFLVPTVRYKHECADSTSPWFTRDSSSTSLLLNPLVYAACPSYEKKPRQGEYGKNKSMANLHQGREGYPSRFVSMYATIYNESCILFALSTVTFAISPPTQDHIIPSLEYPRGFSSWYSTIIIIWCPDTFPAIALLLHVISLVWNVLKIANWLS